MSSPAARAMPPFFLPDGERFVATESTRGPRSREHQLAVHRQPEGDWICLDADTVAEAHGVGLTRARLWDTRGALGVSLQCSLVGPRAE